VQISTFINGSFNGGLFILMWNHDKDGGGVEGLAFYLNPPYMRPVGSIYRDVCAGAGSGSISRAATRHWTKRTPWKVKLPTSEARLAPVKPT
jgi:hypothetical protein